MGYIFNTLASINVETDKIGLEVEQARQELQQNYYTKVETEARLDVVSDKIQLAVDAEVKRATGVEADLNATLELKVNTKDLVSELNMSADNINIKGDRFNLESTNTQIDAAGKITTKNINVTGGNINIDGSANTDEYRSNSCKVSYDSNNYSELSASPSGGYFEIKEKECCLIMSASHMEMKVGTTDYEIVDYESTMQYEIVNFEGVAQYENIEFEDTSLYE